MLLNFGSLTMKKIPLMLEAKMNFGNFVIEIDDYSNVK